MQPNIVLILVDDMGYGDFSAINGGLSQTPAGHPGREKQSVLTTVLAMESLHTSRNLQCSRAGWRMEARSSRHRGSDGRPLL
jgi:hypothetical protein